MTRGFERGKPMDPFGQQNNTAACVIYPTVVRSIQVFYHPGRCKDGRKGRCRGICPSCRRLTRGVIARCRVYQCIKGSISSVRVIQQA